MKQFRTIILLIATSMLLCACPDDKYIDGHKYITIVNKSDIDIGFMHLWENNSFFCDSSRPGGYPFVFVVSSDSLYQHYITDGNILQSWEKYLDKGQIMTIPIVDAEIFYQYWTESCDTIRKHVPILHTYRLTLADLQQMNWTIVFPPEE